jgi:AraC-like DNA-binding protein
MLNAYYANPRHWMIFSHSSSVPLTDLEFHLHNTYEIYLFIAGDVNYFIEKQVYHLSYGDLLLINSHEIHKPTFSSGQPYERYVIHFEPELATLLSAPDFNLLHCFKNRPQGEQNKINLSPSQLTELLQLLNRFESLEANPTPSSAILRLGCFLEILVLLNQAFLNIAPGTGQPNIPEALIPILTYIETHLAEELTLQTLSHQFYMNQSYLSRLFKKGIGSNIHEFIIYKRIAQAKKLLSQGYNVTETCSRCGFNDYANFLRMFKRKVGISPHQYKTKNAAFSKSPHNQGQ